MRCRHQRTQLEKNEFVPLFHFFPVGFSGDGTAFFTKGSLLFVFFRAILICAFGCEIWTPLVTSTSRLLRKTKNTSSENGAQSGKLLEVEKGDRNEGLLNTH